MKSFGKYSLLDASIDICTAIVAAKALKAIWIFIKQPRLISIQPYPLAFIAALLFLGLAYGLYKRSRFCAVAIFSIFLSVLLLHKLEGINYLALVVLLLSIPAIIGSFRYQSLKRSKESLDESK